MANTAAVTDQYKQDILNGVHQPGDTYMAALYTSTGTLSKSTTIYTTSGEVSGTGYTAGGIALTGFTVGLSTDTAYLTFTNPSWASSTLTGVVACLIYNATRSNKAIAVLTFASTSTTAGTFTVVLPAAGASSTVTIS
jgi:hypothetical protein